MERHGKYAALPDVDTSAQDVFEDEGVSVSLPLPVSVVSALGGYSTAASATTAATATAAASSRAAYTLIRGDDDTDSDSDGGESDAGDIDDGLQTGPSASAQGSRGSLDDRLYLASQSQQQSHQPQVVRVKVPRAKAANVFKQAELLQAESAASAASASAAGGSRRGARSRMRRDRSEYAADTLGAADPDETIYERYHRLLFEVQALSDDLSKLKDDEPAAASATADRSATAPATAPASAPASGAKTQPPMSHKALLAQASKLQDSLAAIGRDQHPSVLEHIDPVSTNMANVKQLLSAVQQYKSHALNGRSSSPTRPMAGAAGAASVDVDLNASGASFAGQSGLNSHLASANHLAASAGYSTAGMAALGVPAATALSARRPSISVSSAAVAASSSLPNYAGMAGGLTASAADTVTYEVYYTPTASADIQRTKLIELESRLTNLERIVGMHTLDSAGSVVSDEVRASLFQSGGTLIGALERLDHHLSLIAQPRTLDVASRRIKTVLVELERLSDLERKQRVESKFMSRSMLDLASAASASVGGGVGGVGGTEETSAMVLGDGLTTADSRTKHLYATLVRLEPVMQHLPHLVSRLRALQSLHAEMAVFAESVKVLGEDGARMRDMARSLQENMALLGESLKENEDVVARNVEALGQRIELLMLARQTPA
ncbi:hypothetical protein BC831DRAFT_442857 [Entophlyctis helioformis]|nr:hypothetical protein BC831DRAFT_442857 [Entophlyctis helioformis]